MKYRDLEFSIKTTSEGGEGRSSLAEYGQKNEKENEMSCWISSREGQEFLIHMRNGYENQRISVWTYVDGRLMVKEGLKPGNSSNVYGAQVTRDSEKCFTFAQLKLTDRDDPFHSQQADFDEIGTIKLVVVRSTILYTHPAWRQIKGMQIADIGPVHERSKKAGVHNVTLGGTRLLTSKSQSHRIKLIDALDKPHCVLRFRYRPKEMLQAQGIVPLSPRPSPSPEPQGQEPSQSIVRKRPSGAQGQPTPGPSKRQRITADPTPVKQEPENDEGDDDGSEDLQAQLDAMAATFDSLKANMDQLRARVAAKAKGKQPVKREPSPIAMDSSGDVIDLTLD